VFRAMLADPSLAVVNDYFLQAGGGPPADVVEVGDTVTMIDPVSRRTYPLTVVGVLTSDAALNGAYLSSDFVRSSLGDRAVETRHYVAVAPGQDAEVVARGLTDRFLDRGADARTFRSEVDAALSQFQSFLALMRAYLALGLLVGIAGLGVVMVRAVRERRREIGMLRALGVSGSSIRRAFLLEAGFIALQGVVIGMLLGLVTSWSVLVNSTVFSGSTPAFRVPPIALVVIVVVPLTASLLATLAPAAQASRIQPAVALRIAE
jgi:putative ABC transport system permease protein